MTRQELTQQLIDRGAVAIIRMDDTARLIKVMEAIREGVPSKHEDNIAAAKEAYKKA